MANNVAGVTRAFHAYRAGDLPTAAKVCQAVLRESPDDADAWCLLGVVQRNLGQPSEAAASQREALRLRPNYVEAWNNLGNCLVSLGQFDEATTAFQHSIRLRPENAEAHNNLGAALRKRGALPEAIETFRKALKLLPDYPDALTNLGDTLLEAQRPEEAIAAYEKAIQLRPALADAHASLAKALAVLGRTDEATRHNQEAIRLRPENLDGPLLEAIRARPDDPEAHFKLGNARMAQRKFPEAEVSFREALRLRPDYVEALLNLGNAHLAMRRQTEAEACYREAVRLRPDYAEAHQNLGTALGEQGRPEDADASYCRAIELYRQALQARPEDPHALHHLAIVLQLRGEPRAAMPLIERALAKAPDNPEIHRQLSHALLLLGDWKRGLQEYEWRWKCPELGIMRHSHRPVWDGGPLNGRSVMLHAEQGLGDTLLFARYAPLVRARGGRVLVASPRALNNLLKTCPGIDELVDPDNAPPFDCHVPMATLPRLFDTTPDSVPGGVPYLAADPELVAQWGRELAAFDGLKVGIVWQGNPYFKADHIRSVPLRFYEPLSRVPGVHVFSLQKGHGTEQLRKVSFPVIDLERRLDEVHGSFADTAAILKNIDLLVTSDTSVVHLAGALGVPTWMATSYSPHWYWLLERQDCPWYPSLRLFRQKSAGQWAPVFEQMASALQKMVQQGWAPRVAFEPGELVDRVARRSASGQPIDGALAQERDRLMGDSGPSRRLAADLLTTHQALLRALEVVRGHEERQDFGRGFVREMKALRGHELRRKELIQQINALFDNGPQLDAPPRQTLAVAV